ncbi:hypothetical protein AB0D00_26390 [Streptomyces sp. NPDC048213]|uniref:hypothetical protein n=1 Tax=Streptomyces sp. NPDC048213 TaxID=3160984 RepID=UPI00340C2411
MPPTGTRAITDVRTTVLDPLTVTDEQDERLHGLRCARCGATGPLRAGGHAYTSSEGFGRLGWAVKVCADFCRDYRRASV